MAQLTATGAQGNVNSSVAITHATTTVGEITVFTTANVANQFAIITYALTGLLDPTSSNAATAFGFIGLPGQKMAGPMASTGLNMDTANIWGAAVGYQFGVGVGGGSATGGFVQAFPGAIMVRAKAAASVRTQPFVGGGKIQLGPNTAFKLPYQFRNTDGANDATLFYNLSYHVLYGIY